MDGIIVIDKEKGYTSRDVVNIVSKVYHTKKVGHTGTLDPLATGVLIVCVNKATKLVELLTSEDKVYIAEFEFGTLTDTLDIEGDVLKSEDSIITKEEMISVLNRMIGEYDQTVPIYSAIKVNGKKLYEYARNGEEVQLPVHRVKLFDLELLDLNYENNKTIAKVKCHVSKGTYIRSLGNDIASYFNTNAIMTSLRRIKQGSIDISSAIKVNELNENIKLIPIIDALENYEKVEINNDLLKDVMNGKSIKNIYNKNEIFFINNNEAIAIYKIKDDNDTLYPWKMFKVN